MASKQRGIRLKGSGHIQRHHVTWERNGQTMNDIRFTVPCTIPHQSLDLLVGIVRNGKLIWTRKGYSA